MMSDIQAQEVAVPNSSLEPVASIGEALSAARAEKKLTQQDISNKLRFSVKLIDAIERDAFDELPEPMVTRGFIRNYARLLDLDVEPLLAIYRAKVPDNVSVGLAVQTSVEQISLSKDSQPWLKYILASILVLLLLVVWLFYTDYMPKPTQQAVVDMPQAQSHDAPAVAQAEVKSATEPQTADVAMPEMALPMAERVADAEAANPSVATSEITAPTLTIQESVSQLTPNNKAQASSVSPTAGSNVPPPVKADAPVSAVIKKVNMTFTEKTWVRISDQSGKIVYEKLHQAGESAVAEATPPVSLWIGNAKATKLSVSGKDVDLTLHTSNNIARITLEQ